MIISPETYISLFGEQAKQNVYFIKLNGVEKAELKTPLEEKDGFISLSGKETGKSIFKNIADSLNSVIKIMIFISAIMALNSCNEFVGNVYKREIKYISYNEDKWLFIKKNEIVCKYRKYDTYMYRFIGGTCYWNSSWYQDSNDN